MRIGKQDGAFTAIATSDEHSITIRGRDLCHDLIGKTDFTSYFWLLTLGEEPTDTQRAVTNACLVAIAEHGLVPSVQAARMTLAAAPEAWQGAMSAGLLGMGTVVAGSSETAGRYIVEILKKRDDEGLSLDDAVRASLDRLKAAKAKVPGLGHPQHSEGDPRANVLLRFADDNGVAGDAVACLRALGRIAPEVMGRPLPINVSGAIPALMLDAGWPIEAMKGIPLLARAAGLVAHLYEESLRSIGFILSHKADLAITYDGPSSGREAQ